MYNMFDEEEPGYLGTLDGYIRFDDSEVETPEENISLNIEELFQNTNIQTMDNSEFRALLSNYDLTQVEIHNYQAKFLKAKRISKRQKAKARVGPSCFKLLQPLHVETSESIRTKQGIDTLMVIDRTQEQKRTKRISAQVSRDKKKLYLQNMERQNRILKQKCMELEAQNKKLTVPKNQHSQSRTSSLKSWFIMSLILFSLHQDPNFVDNKPIFENYRFDSSFLFNNAKLLITQYEGQSDSDKMVDFEQFKKMTAISKAQEDQLRHFVCGANKVNLNCNSNPQSKPKLLPQRSLWSAACSQVHRQHL